MSDVLTDSSMSGSPYHAIWTLTWPQMLMMVFHFLIGFVDVWAAGRIDSQVQASLGIITQALFFFLVLAMAVANGGVAAISQSMGALLYKRVRRYTGLLLELALILGVLFALLGLPFRQALLRLLQVPEQMLGVTDEFLEIYLYVLPAYYLLIVCNAIFRAQKKVMFPLYCMIIITVLNTVGDLGLGLGMFGLPRLGYKGLAWATFWSVTAGAAFALFILKRQSFIKRESFAPWRWTKKALPYLFKVAWPSGLMHLVWHSGYLALFAITASLPAGEVTALAAMAVGVRIESILFLPAFAFNFTAGILVGHYLGARKPEEAKRFGYRILLIGLAFVCPLTLGLWLVVGPIVSFLAPSVQVQAESVNYLLYNMAAIPFTLTTMVLAGAFNGAGATLFNLAIMGLSTWLLRLPLAYVLGHEVMGRASGVWISMLCSQAAQSLVMLYFFAFRDWRRFSMIRVRRSSDGS
ncbi:MAG: MATE family efflux transporter [Desulfovibrionaceae bacterium]|nr:MATE family efflux transporter [Desulfovibrionaceae bacterium]